jgi:ATP-binding cassette subfamily B protein
MTRIEPGQQPAEEQDAVGVPIEQWRGQWDERDPDEELSPADGRPRLRTEARALLGDLLRPYKARIVVVFALVIGQVVATMAAPWLIGLVIDHGLPDALRGEYQTLLRLTVLLAAAALLSGLLQWLFLRRIGEIGQAVLFDLRRRVFDHTQRLSVSWHERFTSGRVISRLTSDVDTLRELLDASLDGLLLAVLNITVITVLMLVLDPWLALIALSAVVPLWVLFRWFSARCRRSGANHATTRSSRA